MMLAPAKINLSLNITGHDADNYHLLHGLAIFCDFGSYIDIARAKNKGFTIDYYGDFADDMKNIAISDNIIYQAAKLFCQHYDYALDIEVKLQKNIPIGAGLGGGSSEAATVLLLLNDYYHIHAPIDELAKLAKDLGADVPMCLYRQPLYYAGIGDEITILPYIELPQNIILIKPKQSLSTQQVFAHFAKHHVINAKKFDDGDSLITHIKKFANDLTPSAMALCPHISDIFNDLKQFSAIDIYGMSGSGSCCYGLYDARQQESVDDLLLECQNKDYWCAIGNIIAQHGI